MLKNKHDFLIIIYKEALSKMKMRKQFFFVIAISICAVCLQNVNSNSFSASSSTLRAKFIKGDISAKISAVREATGNDAYILSRNAISFALENSKFISGDRDLSALAVAGILALPENNVAQLSDSEKNILSNEFSSLFSSFQDSTVKISVASKAVQLQNYFSNDNLTNVFNSYVETATAKSDSSVIVHTIQALAVYADERTLPVLYRLYMANDNTNGNIKNELENTISIIAPTLGKQFVLEIISTGDTSKIRAIFDIVQKKLINNESFCAEIAENSLFSTIYNTEKQGQKEVVQLQLDALSVLAQLDWTRSAQTAMKFFDIASELYKSKKMGDNEFIQVVSAVSVLSPIEASYTLSAFLSDLNNMEEKGLETSENVVRAVIGSLGTLGNKQAFDSLLAVTYLSYPDDIIALARDSLSRLRW